MSQKDDRAFLRRFSGIIVGLIIVTVIIIALAMSLRGKPETGVNPSQKRLTEQRIAPVAAVRAGAEGRAELAKEESSAETTPQQESKTPMTGEQVYKTVCTTCHSIGAAGAPVPGTEAMSQRLADKGLDGLVHSALNGLNAMPPKGGRPDLSDEEIRAAVEYMQQ